MSCWQQRLTSNSLRLSHIWRNSEMSDVTFVVGLPPRQRTFHLHKLILSMCSEVFYTTFYGAMQYRGVVNVTDVDPLIFEILIKYIYEEFFSVSSIEEALQTFYLAEKCQMDNLKKLCTSYVHDHLSLENISSFYMDPFLFEHLEVKERCQDILSKRTSEILKNPRFIDFPKALIQHMVHLEKLDVRSEKELFETILNWARSNCSRIHFSYSNTELRCAMHDFLPHIRFLTMGVDELFSCLAKCQIFTDYEIAIIAENIVSPAVCRPLPYWCNRSRVKRQFHSLRLKEYHTCLNEGNFTDYNECTMRVYSSGVTFRGANIYFLSEGPLDISSIIFTIKKKGEALPIEVEMSCDPEKGLLRCMLLRPLVLESCHKYEISIRYCNYIFPVCSDMKESYVSSTDVKSVYWVFILKRPPLRSSSVKGFPHFYEIFYE